MTNREIETPFQSQENKFQRVYKWFPQHWKGTATAAGAVALLVGGLFIYKKLRPEERRKLKSLKEESNGIKGEAAVLSNAGESIRDQGKLEEGLVVLRNLIATAPDDQTREALSALQTMLTDTPSKNR